MTLLCERCVVSAVECTHHHIRTTFETCIHNHLKTPLYLPFTIRNAQLHADDDADDDGIARMRKSFSVPKR